MIFVYIVVKGVITVTNLDDAKRNKVVTFKNNAPFMNCISKINGVQIDNTRDQDVIMPMYNLLEYSKSCRKTTGSLCNYYRDEPSDPLSSNSKSFKYKTIITGNIYDLVAGNANYDATKVGKNETEVVISLKHLSNFWRTLNILLINCQIELVVTWSKFVLADMAAANNPPTGKEFQIADTKLNIPVVNFVKRKWQKTFRAINVRI